MTDIGQPPTADHQQQQFLDVVDRDVAESRFRAALQLAPVGVEDIPLADAWGRTLAKHVVAPGNVPAFDRSNFDGFAVQAADTFGATESRPKPLRRLSQHVVTGSPSHLEIGPGQAAAIATGGMIPRGADAIVMIEHTQTKGSGLFSGLCPEKSPDPFVWDPFVGDPLVWVERPVTPGAGISFAGTDLGAGETVLRAGTPLTSRETGVLAAMGLDRVAVYRRPSVAIFSTGDELVSPGGRLLPGQIFDSNATILADAVRELGGVPHLGGIVQDDMARLRTVLRQAIEQYDVVLLSGGTSKGAGDISYRVVGELTDPGIVAHGVALKPGKPICLAATKGKPVVILPGFPTSAIFTFHEFVAPVIRFLAGCPSHGDQHARDQVWARLAVKANSAIGRTEYCLVRLVPTFSSPAASTTGQPGDAATLAAYPMGKGSGSVTTFCHADGFVTIGRHEEIIEAGRTVPVQLLSRDLRPADLIAIGSHCIGLDYLLGLLEEQGFRTKALHVGSLGGVAAAERMECDIAGVHVLDPKSGQYNQHLGNGRCALISGYGRLQGVVFRPDDARFHFADGHEAISRLREMTDCRMVNRNAGSGTRILIDEHLAGRQPPGYWVQPKSHNAVASAVASGNADWGIAIAPVAAQAGLAFLPLAAEQYDFLTPHPRSARPAVIALGQLLQDSQVRNRLTNLGLAPM